MKRKLTKWEWVLLIVPLVCLVALLGRSKFHWPEKPLNTTLLVVTYLSNGAQIATCEQITDESLKKHFDGPTFVRIYDAFSQEELRKFRMNCWLIAGVACSRDGRLLGAAGHNMKSSSPLVVWDFKSGKRVWQTTSDNLEVAFSPDSKLLVTGQKLRICVMDARTGKILRVFAPKKSSGYSGLQFSPDGKFLATIHFELSNRLEDFPYQVTLWDTKDWTRHRTFAVKAASSLAFSKDSKTLITVGSSSIWHTVWGRQPYYSEYSAINAFDIQSGQQKYELFIPDFVSTVATSPTAQFFAAEERDRITMRETSTGKILKTLDHNRQTNTRAGSLSFSPDGETLTGRDRAHLRNWDVSNVN